MNFLKFITKKIYLFIFSLFLSFGFITSSYDVDITIWDGNTETWKPDDDVIAIDVDKNNNKVTTII